MRKISDYVPALREKIGLQKLKRMIGILPAFPLIVILSIIGIYFVFWKTDPLIRFTHMLWVMGFWMVGTLEILVFIILVRLKIGKSYSILILAALAIALAVYFTPLSRFTNLFSGQTSLILPAAIGILNVTISWFIVLHFSNKLMKP